MNAHFQNGIAKRATRDLQDQVQKQLLHTKGWWPKATPLMLWPFALQNVMHLHNTLHTQDENQWSLKKFSIINVGTRLANIHIFSCPIMLCKMSSREDLLF